MMVGFVDPDSGLGILISVKMVIIAALAAPAAVRPAGRRHDPGAAGGDHQRLFGGRGTGLTFMVYGAIIVLVARFEPGGVHWRASPAPRRAEGRARAA